MRRWSVCAFLLVVLLVTAWYTATRRPQAPSLETSSHEVREKSQGDAGAAAETGEHSFQHEANLNELGEASGSEERAPHPPIQNHVIAKPVKAGASPQAASVAEALRTKEHPERISSLIAPKPFNKAAFEADPEKYLSTVEPGRCFQCAQPGENIPVLKAQGERYARIRPREAVKLTVTGAPLAPVSFTAFDMGEFAESKLNSVTVRADENGVATVNFVASDGALNDCNILAGSPLASGKVRFVVTIEELLPAGPVPAATE